MRIFHFINKFCRYNLKLQRKNMSTNGPKTLFTETGLVDGKSVCLTLGAPAERHLEKVSKFLNKASQTTQELEWSSDFNYLQYGPKAGSPRFRNELAKFLSDGYGSPVKSENLLVTAGATHGLHLVGSILFQNGDTVFVEDPTYFIAINILKGELGMKVEAVPVDDTGVDPAVLESFLQKYQSTSSQEDKDCAQAKREFSSLIYLIPTYHNPMGHCLSAERSKAIVSLARKYDALIFCDDVYNLLHFDSESRAPPRLLTYDDPEDPDYTGGNVLSNSTFSKIMAPGLRLGWIEAGPRITALLTKNNIMWSAGSANQYTSEIVASALESFDAQMYLKGLNAEYRDTVAAMVKTLGDGLPSSCTFSQPKGGYFIWITMPAHASAAEVAKQCLELHSIKLLQGQMCSATGKFANCVRISFSHYPKDVLVESCRRLCEIITEHVNKL